MTKKLLFTLLLLVTDLMIVQGETSGWYSEKDTTLDFNISLPVMLTSSQLATHNAVSPISNKNINYLGSSSRGIYRKPILISRQTSGHLKLDYRANFSFFFDGTNTGKFCHSSMPNDKESVFAESSIASHEANSKIQYHGFALDELDSERDNNRGRVLIQHYFVVPPALT